MSPGGFLCSTVGACIKSHLNDCKSASFPVGGGPSYDSDVVDADAFSPKLLRAAKRVHDAPSGSQGLRVKRRVLSAGAHGDDHVHVPGVKAKTKSGWSGVALESHG